MRPRGNRPMQYVLLYFENPSEIARRGDPAEAPGYWAGWGAYIRMLAESGTQRGGAGLEPSATGTSVSVGAGGRVIADGPFPEPREELGGFVILDVPDLDAAIRFAEAAPCAGAGRVEIRPVLAMPAPATAAGAQVVTA